MNYFRNIFGERVQKLSINAGFTCPNRDGTAGVGGCSYCNAMSFNPIYCNNSKSITQQIKDGMQFHSSRNKKTSKYLAYFQTFSNTYSNLQHLKVLYSQALSFPEVVGLVIGTRPDCVDNMILDYLQSLSETHYVKLEFGIESVYDNTLIRINRGHNYQTTINAFTEAAKRNLHSGGHLIFGLPGETKNMLIDEAAIVSDLPLESLKIHQLQIMKDTAFAIEYSQHPENFHLFELDEYIDLVISFIERLRPDVFIERIASEVPPRFLAIQSIWNHLSYDIVLQKYHQRLQELGTYQGRLSSQSSVLPPIDCISQ